MMISNLKGNGLRHSLKIIYLDFKLSLSSELEYRWQVFMWVLSDLIQPFLLAVIWTAAASSTNEGITPQQMISYYFAITIVLKLTQDWSMHIVSDSISRGEFYKYLLRPFNYLEEMLGLSLAFRTMRIMILVPFIIVGYFLLRDMLQYQVDPMNLILFSLAVIGGFFLSFLIGNTFALITFHIKQITGLKALYVNLVSVLSGEYVPFALLGLGSALIFFYIQPFRYILSFPVEILMGILSTEEILSGFGIMICWIIIISFVYYSLLKFSLKKYEAEGL